jgi:dolichol-phosphate hexosyltransferase
VSEPERKVSVVIPALNEEAGIGYVLDEIPRADIESLGYALEVIVVDGESVDRTREISEEKGARVIVEPRKGYGRAYKTGFAEATGDVIVTGDADTTYPFDHIPEFLTLLEKENLDFITTNRFAKLENGAMSAKHKLGNWVLSSTARVLFLVNVKDSQSGMWIFRRPVLEKVTLTSDGMPLSEEIKIEAFLADGVRAREIPIEYRSRVGDVKLASWQDGARNLAFLFRKRFGLAEVES